MDQNDDLIDLLHALNAAGAKFLIVGGYAFAFHGRVRATKDIDLFVGTDAENARRVWTALSAFGAPLDELTEEDLTRPETFFVMGRPPNQIDIITTIDGVSFSEAWEDRVESFYGSEPLNYIGRRHLIQNKRVASRPQDLADVAYLTDSRDREGG